MDWDGKRESGGMYIKRSAGRHCRAGFGTSIFDVALLERAYGSLSRGIFEARVGVSKRFNQHQGWEWERNGQRDNVRELGRGYLMSMYTSVCDTQRV